MFNTNSRHTFLNQCWLRYPPMPAGSDVLWGRIQRTESLCVITRAGSFVAAFSWNQLRWCPKGVLTADAPQAAEVLHDLDWVALWPDGELQVVQLLAPCLGAAVETRLTYEVSHKWHLFTRAVRDHFHEHGFLETPTPLLVPSPGTEPFLEPFTTEFQLGSQTRSRFLPFSPEFHLKKLLSLGWERIFEIKACFRNNELSERHQPEFWMLEWYRAGCTLETLLNDVQALFRRAAFSLNHPDPEPLKQVTVASLFQTAYGFQLTPQTSSEELRELALAHGLHPELSDSWDDLFFRLFLEKIEPYLGFDGPVAVRDYPPSQAALARVNSRGWADRFEVYWNGLELANAFYELNDPVEQRQRFAIELESRKGAKIDIDPEFLQALEHGLPPASGIALGLERLFMALTGLKRLDEVRAFPEKV